MKQTKDFRPDEQQQRVISHATGPLRVFGGPGTGKTLTLEERFARLACQSVRGEGDCTADRVLFLVPNRAQKMVLQDRLTRRLLFDEGVDALIDVPVYTWHGLANHLVTRHYDRLAYSEPPVLLTSPEQWGAIRDALGDEADANWPHHKHLLRNRGFVDEVVDFFIRVGQRAMEPTDLDRLAQVRPEWAELVDFYKRHHAQLRQSSRVDYPTLLRDAAELIANFEDVREQLHQRFLHVLVDDGQELAFVQQRLLRFLTGFVDSPETSKERSLVVAGDPDSSIETFRGADPDWLADFEREFGPHDTVTLETSYRLGSEFASSAIGFIERNGTAEHRPKTHAGETSLEVLRYPNLAAEMEAVARDLRLAHLREQIPYEDMAILLTSPRSMLPALERALGAVEVPYQISAPDRPLDREPAVRTFSELAHYAYEAELDEERLAELLRSPLFGLDIQDVRDLERAAREKGMLLSAYVEHVVKADEADDRVVHLIELRDLLREHEDAPADFAFYSVWERASHYGELVARSKESLADPANRELDSLVAFSRALGRFVERRLGKGTLRQYRDALTRADFGSDPWLPPERRSGGVEVLSFHAAKGKEWSLVAVCGCVEGAIPKGRRAQGIFDPYFLDETSAIQRARKNEAEDRRVFYVAVTRAKSRCIVTTSPGPTRKGQPSRFLGELLDADLPEVSKHLELPPLTFSEAAARQRQVLANTKASATERLAALEAIVKICELDPSCTASQPSEWWWRWDWTEGAIRINEQRAQGDADDLPPDKLRTSYSRISEYDNCGLRYLYQVVLGLDPDTSHNMAFGSWIHKIFEECETGKLTNKEAAFARYEELFDDGVFPNRAIARQFHRDGERMLERYINYLEPGDALLVEQEFRIDFDGHKITGRIDRVDKKGNGVIVKDYKTSRYPIFVSEAKESLQLAIYYLAAKQIPEIAEHGDPIAMQLVYPGHMSYGKITVRVQQPEEAEAVAEALPRLIEGVIDEDFRPRPDADCMWCKFKPICPLWAEGKELPA